MPRVPVLLAGCDVLLGQRGHPVDRLVEGAAVLVDDEAVGRGRPRALVCGTGEGAAAPREVDHAERRLRLTVGPVDAVLDRQSAAGRSALDGDRQGGEV